MKPTTQTDEGSQCAFMEGVKHGIDAVDRGDIIPHSTVDAAFESLLGNPVHPQKNGTLEFSNVPSNSVVS